MTQTRCTSCRPQGLRKGPFGCPLFLVVLRSQVEELWKERSAESRRFLSCPAMCSQNCDPASSTTPGCSCSSYLGGDSGTNRKTTFVFSSRTLSLACWSYKTNRDRKNHLGYRDMRNRFSRSPSHPSHHRSPSHPSYRTLLFSVIRVSCPRVPVSRPRRLPNGGTTEARTVDEVQWLKIW